MRQAGSTGRSKKKNGMNSLHKRLSLFKSPKLRRKLPIHNNDVPHSSTNISHRGAAYDPQAMSYPTQANKWLQRGFYASNTGTKTGSVGTVYGI
jgi:hypothetical protein